MDLEQQEPFAVLQLQDVNLNPRPYKMYLKCCGSFALQVLLYTMAILSFGVAVQNYDQPQISELLGTFSGVLAVYTRLGIESSKMMIHQNGWRESCWSTFIPVITFLISFAMFIYGNVILSDVILTGCPEYLAIFTETVLSLYTIITCGLLLVHRRS